MCYFTNLKRKHCKLKIFAIIFLFNVLFVLQISEDAVNCFQSCKKLIKREMEPDVLNTINPINFLILRVAGLSDYKAD